MQRRATLQVVVADEPDILRRFGEGIDSSRSGSGSISGSWR